MSHGDEVAVLGETGTPVVQRGGEEGWEARNVDMELSGEVASTEEASWARCAEAALGGGSRGRGRWSAARCRERWGRMATRMGRDASRRRSAGKKGGRSHRVVGREARDDVAEVTRVRGERDEAGRGPTSRSHGSVWRRARRSDALTCLWPRLIGKELRSGSVASQSSSACCGSTGLATEGGFGGGRQWRRRGEERNW
ncbi:hypothetical protein EJB05_22741, partial [Eragrostis curvula]